MRFSFIKILVLPIVLFVAGVAFAQKIEITRGAAMRAAGKYEFRARTNKIDSRKIVWTLECQVLNLKGETNLTKNVTTANGKRAAFDLTADADTETVYLVRAEAEGVKDEFSVRVFPAGQRAFFTYRSAGNPDVRTFIVAPPKLNAQTRVVMVMHGRSRNADGYIETWREWASRNNYIALAPEFDDVNWKGAAKYNLGNMFKNEEGAGVKNPEANWSFTIVENIHQTVRESFGIKDKKFDLWGHSAGGQFVHRFMLFKPNARVRYAMPANSGWYTAPDLNVAYPHGVRHPILSVTASDLKRWTSEPVIIFRGTADTERTENLSQTPEADAQGQNRFVRAGFMFRQIRAFNSKTKWTMIDVPAADHNQRKMAPAAQRFLENPRMNSRAANIQAANFQAVNYQATSNQTDVTAAQFYQQAIVLGTDTAADLARRRELLEESVKLDADFAPALAALGSIYAKTGKSEESVALLNRALKISPNTPTFHSTLGYVYRYAGLLDESIEAYRQSQRLDASLINLIDTEEQITKALIYKGDYRAALDSHDKVTAYYKTAKLPHDHKELFYAGVINFYLKDTDAAAKFFDAAAQINPTSIWSLFGQAYKQAGRGDFENLSARARQLETLDIVDGERRYRLAHFYAIAEKPDDALRNLRAAIEGGFFNYPYISRDPLLANIRNTNEFQTLLGAAKKRHEKFKEMMN